MDLGDQQKYYIKTHFKENIEPEEIILDAEKIKGAEFDDYPLERKLEVPINSEIFIWFFIIICLVFVIFLARDVQLQVIEGNKYQQLAENNRIRLQTIPANRGIIYDRFGEALVRNIPSFNVIIDSSNLPRKQGELTILAAKLSKILDFPEEDIQKELKNSLRLRFFQKEILLADIDHQKMLTLETELKNLPGIEIEQDIAREYIWGPSFAHVLGYMGKIASDEIEKYRDYSLTEKIGKSGLEAQYEKVLHGSSGYREIEVDALGREKQSLGTKLPVNGLGLKLSIDNGLQKYLYEQLSALKQEAVGVALDPRNGQILAMVSLPSFDNNIFSKAISNKDFQLLINTPNKPLLNRVISGEYPPGSTIKPLLATAGLEEGIITRSTVINDSNGEIFVGSFRFGDWKIHGLTDIIKAIAESCDVFFYYVGGGYGDFKGLGIEKISQYFKMYGFGSLTGVDLLGEKNGLVPSSQWKQDAKKEKWYIGDTYHTSIGQGDLLVTPLQLAVATAAIANGGTLYRPYLVDSIIDQNKKVIEKIQLKVLNKNFISAKNISIVRQGMRQVVVSGTARSLSALPVAVAGKTGTAEFGSGGQTHAWFTAFAPYENPQITLVILVEGGGEGSSAAVPIAREVLKWYFNR